MSMQMVCALTPPIETISCTALGSLIAPMHSLNSWMMCCGAWLAWANATKSLLLSENARTSIFTLLGQPVLMTSSMRSIGTISGNFA